MAQKFSIAALASALLLLGLTVLAVGSSWAEVSKPIIPDKSEPVAEVARAEFNKRPAENRGNNIPQYKSGQGRVAPYSTATIWTGKPWGTTFVSIVMQRAGFSAHLRGGALPVVGGKALASPAMLLQRARENRRLRSEPRRGYLALIKPGVLNNRQTVTPAVILSSGEVGTQQSQVTIIGGDIKDRAQRLTLSTKRIAYFIAPW